MPNKPDKYGLKFWVMAEVDSKYICNILPYLGAQERDARNGIALGEDVVMRLIQPVQNRGYNICCDNFFTSLSLAKSLSAAKTSIVGTLRRNKREVSQTMTAPSKVLHKSQFYWQRDSKTLFVNYQAKKNKNVCLISTMHASPTVDDTLKKKPAIIHFYNQNKVGVDVFDQMARQFSVHCASRRWPLAVWSNMLDIAAINSWIVYKKRTGSKISRRMFILQLVDELRLADPVAAAPIVPAPFVLRDVPLKRKKCHVAGCRNNSASVCKHCAKVTCGTCSTGQTLQLVACRTCANL